MGTNSPFLVLSSYGILHLRKLLEKQTILGKVDIWNKLFFFRFYLFIFRERRKEGEREGEKYQCVVASCPPPTVDLACNPGMCPGWELNRQPFGSQARAQSTGPHQLR